jgi:hypothetical protein
MFSHHLTHLKPFAAGRFKHIGLDVGLKNAKAIQK